MSLPLLQVTALALVAVVLTATLAHALELPGKLRLGREDYLTVQGIYYPGFTRAGLAEPAAILALLLLLLMTPMGLGFWLTLGAFLAMVAVHATFWLVTQPVNRVWVAELDLGRADAAFFATGRRTAEANWTTLRDRWERSHVIRAVASSICFLLLATATAVRT
jgi:hypothetical protein